MLILKVDPEYPDNAAILQLLVMTPSLLWIMISSRHAAGWHIHLCGWLFGNDIVLWFISSRVQGDIPIIGLALRMPWSKGHPEIGCTLPVFLLIKIGSICNTITYIALFSPVRSWVIFMVCKCWVFEKVCNIALFYLTMCKQTVDIRMKYLGGPFCFVGISCSLVRCLRFQVVGSCGTLVSAVS